MKYSFSEYSPYTNQKQNDKVFSANLERSNSTVQNQPNTNGIIPNIQTPRTTVPTTPGMQPQPRTTMPATPATPATPAIPGMPTQPRTTMPATPATPATPGMPGMPSQTRPTMPATPATPGMPSQTRPTMPATPATPGMPTQPRTTMPATPATPGMPSQTRPTMPGTTMPGTTMPGTTMPGTTMPGTTMPGTTMPGTTMPGTTMPGTTMPGTTMPGTTMPGTTMPGTTMPGTTMPGTTMPGTTMPGTTMPGATMSSHKEYTTRPRSVYSSNHDVTDNLSSDKTSMYMQDPFVNPYNLPMGVPMMPLYGYDNTEDADKDWDYMKQMYPVVAKKILADVEDECDKLEYDGSCMFDEYPDRVYLSRIVDRIYEKVKYLDDEAVRGSENISASSKEDFEYVDSKIIPNQYPFGRFDDRHRRDRNFRLRDLIEILLFNEILNRRRRFRGRRRWF
ncbi:MAG: hypothetical protein K0R92_1414 [Lachnospiraceae bacterium]|nr:hypothetical protein [Lachnospiraceae bacterium]